MFHLKAQLAIGGSSNISFEIKGKQNDFWIARNALHVALSRVAEDIESCITPNEATGDESTVSDIVFTPEASSETQSHLHEDSNQEQYSFKRPPPHAPCPSAPWASSTSANRRPPTSANASANATTKDSNMPQQWLIWNTPFLS